MLSRHFAGRHSLGQINCHAPLPVVQGAKKGGNIYPEADLIKHGCEAADELMRIEFLKLDFAEATEVESIIRLGAALDRSVFSGLFAGIP